MTEQRQCKKIAFLAPRPDLDPQAFATYWRDTHGPTVAHAPGYAAYRTRYAQNHRIGDGPVGAPFPYPGAALFHLPGDGSNEAEFSASATYQDHIRVDELNFIDMAQTLSMAATECVIRAGTGPVKLLTLGIRRDGVERDQFDRRLRDACTDALRDASGFADHLRGWTLNHIVEGSFQLPGARQADAFAVDCIQEMWFADEQALAAAFDSPDYRDNLAKALGELFATPHSYSFHAREIVFFDAGRPIDGAARECRNPPLASA